MITKIQQLSASIVAIMLVFGTYTITLYPTLSHNHLKGLASHFKFFKVPIADNKDHPRYKYVRTVHPSLSRISAWISAMGAGATLADLDGDGLANDLIHIDPRTDLVTVGPVPNTGHRYESFVLAATPLPYDPATTAPMGALAGDFNEDGLMDILVYFWGRSPVIYLRNSFESPLLRAGFTATELTTGGERWFTNAAVETDLDGDGHVDLVIGNYFQDGSRILDEHATGIETMHAGKAKALNGGYKHVFLWQSARAGNAPIVTYSEQKDVFSEVVARGWTLAIGAADLDGDQLAELYLGNDFGPDHLLHNCSIPGHLQFVELKGKRDLCSLRGFSTPKSCILGQDSFKGMGCDFGDINGDGIFDIYVSNITAKFGLTESNFLWQSTELTSSMKDDEAPYFQNSEKLGLSRSGWGWDCRLADFNNDGILEAIQAVGFIKGETNRWPELQALGTSNSSIVHDPRVWPSFKPGADLSGHDLTPFFVRASDGRYYDVGKQVGFNEPMISKGLALSDVDGDGRLDFVLANQWESSFFFHNESPHVGAFLGLHLLLPLVDAAKSTLYVRPGHPGSDTAGRPAYGAQAMAHLASGKIILAQIDGGSGHSGRRSPDIHLGLGNLNSDQSVRVEIKWRDGVGQPRHTDLEFKPGWYTVCLGN